MTDNQRARVSPVAQKIEQFKNCIAEFLRHQKLLKSKDGAALTAFALSSIGAPGSEWQQQQKEKHKQAETEATESRKVVRNIVDFSLHVGRALAPDIIKGEEDAQGLLRLLHSLESGNLDAVESLWNFAAPALEQAAIKHELAATHPKKSPIPLWAKYSEEQRRLSAEKRNAAEIAEMNFFAYPQIESITDPQHGKRLRIYELTDDQMTAFHADARGKPDGERKRLAISHAAKTWDGIRWFAKHAKTAAGRECVGTDLATFDGLSEQFINEAYQTCLRVNPKMKDDANPSNAEGPATPNSPAAAKNRETKPFERKRGRPTDTDLAFDKRVYDAWNTGEHKDYADLGRKLHITKKETGKAVDRHRKRISRGTAPG